MKDLVASLEKADHEHRQLLEALKAGSPKALLEAQAHAVAAHLSVSLASARAAAARSEYEAASSKAQREALEARLQAADSNLQQAQAERDLALSFDLARIEERYTQRIASHRASLETLERQRLERSEAAILGADPRQAEIDALIARNVSAAREQVLKDLEAAEQVLARLLQLRARGI